MSGKILTLYYDQLTDQLIDSSNVAAVTSLATIPEFFRNNEHTIFRLYVYSDASTSTESNLSTIASYSGKIGKLGSTALMTAANATFNLAADWASADVAHGKICFWINSGGTAIDTDLGTVESKQYYCSIVGTDADSDDRTIVQFAVQLNNTPD